MNPPTPANEDDIPSNGGVSSVEDAGGVQAVDNAVRVLSAPIDAGAPLMLKTVAERAEMQPTREMAGSQHPGATRYSQPDRLQHALAWRSGARPGQPSWASRKRHPGLHGVSAPLFDPRRCGSWSDHCDGLGGLHRHAV